MSTPYDAMRDMVALLLLGKRPSAEVSCTACGSLGCEACTYTGKRFLSSLHEDSSSWRNEAQMMIDTGFPPMGSRCSVVRRVILPICLVNRVLSSPEGKTLPLTIKTAQMWADKCAADDWRVLLNEWIDATEAAWKNG